MNKSENQSKKKKRASFRIHEDEVYEFVDNNLVQGYVRSENELFEKKVPSLNWKGGKLPLSLWRQVVAFFLWTQKKYKSESQVRLFYKQETKEWLAWAFPQWGVGMSTEELEDDERTEEQRKQFAGFIPLGTIHHHCDTSAFQSGTDEKDENNVDGIHITVGNLNSKRLDYHGRFVYNGTTYTAALTNWVEGPEISINTDVNPTVLSRMMETFLLTEKDDQYQFPDVWKSNFQNEEPRKQYVGFNNHNYHGGTVIGGQSYVPFRQKEGKSNHSASKNNSNSKKSDFGPTGLGSIKKKEKEKSWHTPFSLKGFLEIISVVLDDDYELSNVVDVLQGFKKYLPRREEKNSPYLSEQEEIALYLKSIYDTELKQKSNITPEERIDIIDKFLKNTLWNNFDTIPDFQNSVNTFSFHNK